MEKYCNKCGKKFKSEIGHQTLCYKCRSPEYIGTYKIKPTKLCADCKKVKTFNHRCPSCLTKFRNKHKVEVGNGINYDL